MSNFCSQFITLFVYWFLILMKALAWKLFVSLEMKRLSHRKFIFLQKDGGVGDGIVTQSLKHCFLFSSNNILRMSMSLSNQCLLWFCSVLGNWVRHPNVLRNPVLVQLMSNGNFPKWTQSLFKIVFFSAAVHLESAQCSVNVANEDLLNCMGNFITSSLFFFKITLVIFKAPK